MNVSIIIPNFNGKHLLKKNLPDVVKAAKNAQIIVIDDASTDESAAFIKKHYPNVTLIEKVTNNGFATSVNLGVKAASGEIIYLLNSDCVPQKDFLAFLLPHFKDPNVFAVGSLDQSVEENKTIERGRGTGWFERGFLMHRRGDVNDSSTLWVSGGSSAFRKSMWQELGGMDELYDPFYWEDIDLSYRAQKRGWKVVFEKKSVVTHIHAKGTIKSHFSQSQIKTIAYRNQFIFVWKNMDTSYLFQHIVWLPYHKFSALLRGDASFFKGMLQAFFLLPVILETRQKNKFTVADEKIFLTA